MRTLIVALLLPILPALAQNPAPPTTPRPAQATKSLSFDARSVSSGGGSSLNRSSGGSLGTSTGVVANSTKTRSSQTVLELKVRNLSATMASGQFDYYFIAQGAGKAGPYIWSSGTLPVTLEPGRELKELLQSTELVQATTQTTTARSYTPSPNQPSTQYTSSSQKSGARPVGWIVRLMADGEVVRVLASSSEYEKAGRDSAGLRMLQFNAPAPAPAPVQPGVPPR